ncbi:hypothetical protein P691DRAFT_700852 [Macrolepiota fuliginosa MF-IS2]|uniref:Uncharacterized protein n=1 Tax=Macrolepiota fuliginosa MF-IS2 TaxID=1400762 RepID=A0A9P5XJF6_9AGAR|nr:hypothetical protein P691DRAFT_700852 [Macrolepiota fuliginosa MF-IS2]
MGTRTLDKEVSVVFSAALLFGIYFSTLLTCFRWLLFADEGWKRRKTIDWALVVVTFLIFGINVAHVSWDLHWTMVEAFQAVNGPRPFEFTLPDFRNIVACVLQNTSILLADIVLIRRCWVVHGRRKLVVVFPVFLWLVALLCTILQIYLQVAHMKNPNIGPYSWASVNMTIGPGIVLLPFWISTVLSNAYASGALILRIHQVTQQCKFVISPTHLYFLIRVIAESGLLCLSITLAHFLVWFGSDDYAVGVIAALNPPVMGVAFNWFIIRVAINKAEAAKVTIPERITTIRFNKPPTTHHGTMMDGTNGLVSGGAAFELAMYVISSV